MDVASRLFHEQGFHATGITTILREAEVNRGSLYHFFNGKEELLAAVLEDYLDRLRPEILGPVEDATADPIERVVALADGYRAFLEQTSLALGCPIGNLALEVAYGNEKVRELIDRNFRQWVAGVEQWVASIHFERSIRASAVAGFVLTVIEGAIMRCRVAGTLEPFDESVDELKRYLDLISR